MAHGKRAWPSIVLGSFKLLKRTHACQIVVTHVLVLEPTARMRAVLTGSQAIQTLQHWTSNAFCSVSYSCSRYFEDIPPLLGERLSIPALTLCVSVESKDRGTTFHVGSALSLTCRPP